MPDICKPVVTFLGPEGTYTHQAAFNRFGTSVVYSEKQSIADVFHALSPETPFAVIPKENSIFGPVVETYDLLRTSDRKYFIQDEITLQIKHCLVVRKGTRLQDISRVMSHEQALGQCSHFMRERLPNATLVKTPSTAYAAAALLSKDVRGCAAVCSSICTTLYDGIEILFDGIQNENTNFTKFWVLSDSSSQPLPSSPSPGSQGVQRALIRVSCSSNHPDLLPMLSALNELSVVHIDRRPAADDIPFRDVCFIEVTEKPERRNEIQLEQNDSGTAEDRCELFGVTVDDAVQRIKGMGWEACTLGIW